MAWGVSLGGPFDTFDFIDNSGNVQCYLDSDFAMACPAQTAPTISQCGTGATHTGNDSTGYIVVGAGPGFCTLNFGTKYASSIVPCLIQDKTTGAWMSGVNSSVSLTLGTAVFGDTVAYHCENAYTTSN